jgi:hypothetical protein
MKVELKVLLLAVRLVDQMVVQLERQLPLSPSLSKVEKLHMYAVKSLRFSFFSRLLSGLVEGYSILFLTTTC